MAHPVVDFLVALIPQKDDDEVKMLRWRWCSVVLGLGTLTFVLYLAGQVPGVDSPFAYASGSSPNSLETVRKDLQGQITDTKDDVRLIAKKMDYALSQLKDGQIRQLNSDLIDARRYQCRAIAANDESAKPFWNSRLQTLKRSYNLLANETWPDLPCNSF